MNDVIVLTNGNRIVCHIKKEHVDKYFVLTRSGPVHIYKKHILDICKN